MQTARKLTARANKPHAVANQPLTGSAHRRGLKKVAKPTFNTQAYQQQFLKTVQRKPIASVLTAVSLGFILSKLFQR